MDNQRAVQTVGLGVLALGLVAGLIWLAVPRADSAPELARVVIPAPEPQRGDVENPEQRVSLATEPVEPWTPTDEGLSTTSDRGFGPGTPAVQQPPPPGAAPLEQPHEPVPSEPAPTAPSYEEKYADQELAQLDSALQQLRARQVQLADALARERAEQGLTRRDGPFPKDSGYSLAWLEDHPLQHRPHVVVVATEELEGSDQIMVELVEITPSDSPELRSLRDEEVWLTLHVERHR